MENMNLLAEIIISKIKFRWKSPRVESATVDDFSLTCKTLKLSFCDNSCVSIYCKDIQLNLTSTARRNPVSQLELPAAAAAPASPRTFFTRILQ